MSMSTQQEYGEYTRAWIQGLHDAERDEPRKAPYDETELIEAYAAGYDSVESK